MACHKWGFVEKYIQEWAWACFVYWNSGIPRRKPVSAEESMALVGVKFMAPACPWRVIESMPWHKWNERYQADTRRFIRDVNIFTLRNVWNAPALYYRLLPDVPPSNRRSKARICRQKWAWSSGRREYVEKQRRTKHDVMKALFCLAMWEFRHWSKSEKSYAGRI